MSVETNRHCLQMKLMFIENDFLRSVPREYAWFFLQCIRDYGEDALKRSVGEFQFNQQYSYLL